MPRLHQALTCAAVNLNSHYLAKVSSIVGQLKATCNGGKTYQELIGLFDFLLMLLFRCYKSLIYFIMSGIIITLRSLNSPLKCL